MNKPKWENAPHWAKFLSMDSDSLWWWYENKPYLYDDCTWDASGLSRMAKLDNDNWKETLEQRPENRGSR